MNVPELTTENMVQPSTQQLNVLLSAYACEPGRGSEPGVGWNTAREVARYHRVWVLTSATHKTAIEAELRDRPIPNLHIVYLDPFSWVIDWSQEGKRRFQGDVHLHYYLWQIQAYFVAQRLHQEIQFDLAHHVTYVRYSSPSFLSLLPIPFLWGPVGGGESAPKAFQQNLQGRAKAYEFLRDLFRRVGELDPFVHLTARRSKLALATTDDTAKCLQHVGARHIQTISQIGLNDEEIAELTRYSSLSQSNLPIRFISVGRLLHWKGFHLGLEAFAKAGLPEQAEYWVVGEGPELQSLKALAEKLGIRHQVTFWNKLSRPETLQRLSECLALVHPSLHDSGGLVCLEAMAAGCPVICLDLGGPGIVVTPETGFKVAACTPVQAIQDIAQAMVQIAGDSQLRMQLGQAGKTLINQQFRWQGKAKILDKIYCELIAKESIANVTK